MSDGGKGDTPRPFGVSKEVFDTNFDAIFGKKTKLPQPEMKEVRDGQRDKTNEMGDENG